MTRSGLLIMAVVWLLVVAMLWHLGQCSVGRPC